MFTYLGSMTAVLREMPNEVREHFHLLFSSVDVHDGRGFGKTNLKSLEEIDPQPVFHSATNEDKKRAVPVLHAQNISVGGCAEYRRQNQR